MLSVALTTRARTAVRIAATIAAILCFSSLHATTIVQPMSWLKTENYSALERYLADLQLRYESGGVPERQLYEGFRALYEEGADNAQYFNRWMQAYPNSYAARTARGAYYYRMAMFVRGGESFRNTPPERIQAMHMNLARARPDLLTSLKMSAKPYLSALYLLNVARLAGPDEERRQWLDAGNAIDPHNELLRLRYLNCLTPRWGGSLQEMRAFRAETERQHVSAALLTKFDVIIHTETAQAFAKNGDFTEALHQWEQVLKLATNGEPPSDEALIGYARSAWHLHRTEDADWGLRQLARRDVGEGWVLAQMGWIYVEEGRMTEAWAVLRKGALLNDPWAQFSVGKTTYQGCADIHLPANRSAGLVWIRRSADHGFPEAKAFLLEHDR